MSLVDVLQALVEKQTKLISAQTQLLDRIRRFGDEGASELKVTVRDVTVEIEHLERTRRALLAPARAPALT